MWRIELLSTLAFWILSGVNCQTGGTVNGNSYVCVPAGFCNNNGGPSSPGIDPRIVVPAGTTLCPAGQIACYTQGPGSNCGVHFVPQTTTVDGNADRSAYPWQVYLRNSTNQYAGSGVLLDNFHVLTAAHKVFLSQANPSSVTVFAGVYLPSDIGTTPVQSRPVASITVHPMFNSTTLKNDLAILRLSSPIMLSSNNVNTACLPAQGASYVGAQRCVVAGWGQTAFTTNDAPTNPMKQVYVNIVDINTCRTSFASAALLGTNVDLYLDTAGGEICAGGQSMRDACTQDGGSPLVCPDSSGRSYIAGLVIWGKNCGQPGVYGVYVNPAYYRGWIDTTITSLNAAAG